ncbi:putative ATPase family protein [Trypanosoma vivax]|uniref:Putative vacuolar transport protein 4A n=1 Tax=Trypanosoma vivax (strain Y486) TaxID=1055687 RepID=G0TU09_TRYVY|nr:putative ATPase family protein [Trypanosoma vivax]CCC47442.1 putative vacuolar transport protein 4A [Trypanosoma vivax Y486]
MAATFYSRKVDEVSQLVDEARKLLLHYGCHKNADAAALMRLHKLLRSILQSVSLIQAYDPVPHRCNVYDYISKSFHGILELQLEQNLCDNNVQAVPKPGSEEEEGGKGATPLRIPVPHPARGSALGHSAKKVNPVRWADIAGCSDAIAALKRATVLPQRFPQLFQGPRRPLLRILLYGPPGTGKTLLAAATSTECATPLVTISSADIMSKWIGESERHVRRLFEDVASLPRCILFFDEIDAVCGARGVSGESEASRRVKTELLIQLQDLPADRVTFIAATNMPWELDSAILRRFDQQIFVDMPPPDARHKLITGEIKCIPHDLTEDDMHWLVDVTGGYSASDICRVVQHAVMAPVQQIAETEHMRPVDGEEGVRYVPCTQKDEDSIPIERVPPNALHIPTVCRQHFEAALSAFPPTIPSDELEKFVHWRFKGKGTAVSS